jgi:hypothetical protein
MSNPSCDQGEVLQHAPSRCDCASHSWCGFDPRDAVAATYGRWCAAPTGEGAPRFAAYVAALDREEAAAAMCAESIIVLKRRLRDLDSDRGSEPRAVSG